MAQSPEEIRPGEREADDTQLSADDTREATSGSRGSAPHTSDGFDSELGASQAETRDLTAQSAGTVDDTGPVVESSRSNRLESLSGKTIAGYEVVSMIGRGNMGIVYRARQQDVGDRDVALKVMSPQAAEDLTARERFRNEAPAAGQLETDFVVPVFERRTQDGLEFLVMEYIGGGTLHDHAIGFGGKLPIAEAARLLLEACRGLYAAETNTKNGKPNPIYHRDIKPRNILLKETIDNGKPTKHVRIGDFGAAKISDADLTQYSRAPMTPRYASPEQWFDESAKVDHRSDMYSLGATFYEMLVGKAATADKNEEQIREFVANTDDLDPRKARPEIPIALSNVIRRLTAKDPRSRYHSFAEPIQQLRLLTEHKPVHVAAPRPIRQPANTGWIGFAASLVIAISAWFLYQAFQPVNGSGRSDPISSKLVQHRLDLGGRVAKLREFLAVPVPSEEEDLRDQRQALSKACQNAEGFLNSSAASGPDAVAKMDVWRNTLDEAAAPIQRFRTVATQLTQLETRLQSPEDHSGEALATELTDIAADRSDEVLAGLKSRLDQAADAIEGLRSARRKQVDDLLTVPDDLRQRLAAVDEATDSLTRANEAELVARCRRIKTQLETVADFGATVHRLQCDAWTFPARYNDARSELGSLPAHLRQFATTHAHQVLDRYFAGVTPLWNQAHVALAAKTRSAIRDAGQWLQSATELGQNLPTRPQAWSADAWAAWPQHVQPPPGLMPTKLPDGGHTFSFGRNGLANYPLLALHHRRGAVLIGQRLLSVAELKDPLLIGLRYSRTQSGKFAKLTEGSLSSPAESVSHVAARMIAETYRTRVAKRAVGSSLPRREHLDALTDDRWSRSAKPLDLDTARLEWTDGSPSEDGNCRGLLWRDDLVESLVERRVINRNFVGDPMHRVGIRLAIVLR